MRGIAFFGYVVLAGGATLLAKVSAPTPRFHGGQGDNPPDSCYRQIQHEIDLLSADMDRTYKEFEKTECKKAEYTNRATLTKQETADEIFNIMNDSVRCSDCSSTSYTANDAQTIIASSCGANYKITPVPDLTKLIRYADRSGTTAETNNPAEPTGDAWETKKKNLKDYAEETAKYCYEVFRIDTNLQSIKRVHENKLQNAGGGGHFFLQTSSKEGTEIAAPMGDNNNPMTAGSCSQGTSETSCHSIVVQTTNFPGTTSFCTWDGATCSDVCDVSIGDPGIATCGDAGPHCRAEGNDCYNMIKDIDTELQQCATYETNVKTKIEELDQAKAAYDQEYRQYKVNLDIYLENMRTYNAHAEMLRGLCDKAKAAQLMIDENVPTARPADTWSGKISELIVAKSKLESPEVRKVFNPEPYQAAFFLQEKMEAHEAVAMRTKVVSELYKIAQKTGLAEARLLAQFLSTSRQPVILGGAIGASAAESSIFWTIHKRKTSAQNKITDLRETAKQCREDLDTDKSEFEIAVSELEVAEMDVHKSRAKLAQRLLELNEAKADYVSATNSHQEESDAKDAWKFRADNETEEAKLMADEMKTQNTALFAALTDGNFTGTSVRARIEGVCTRVQHVLEGRYLDLVNYRTLENTRRVDLVADLNTAKSAALSAQQSAQTAYNDESDDLGTVGNTNAGVAASGYRKVREDKRTARDGKNSDWSHTKRVCNHLLDEVDARIENERRNVMGLIELEGVLSHLIGGTSARVAHAEHWQVQKNGLNTDSNSEYWVGSCPTKSEGECNEEPSCIWDNYGCYPVSLWTGPDGNAYGSNGSNKVPGARYGTDQAMPFDGQTVTARDGDRDIKAATDERATDAEPDDGYEGASITNRPSTVGGTDTPTPRDPLDFPTQNPDNYGNYERETFAPTAAP